MRLTQAIRQGIALNADGIIVNYDGRKWFDVIGQYPDQVERTDQLDKAQAYAEAWGASPDGWRDMVAEAACMLPVTEETP